MQKNILPIIGILLILIIAIMVGAWFLQGSSQQSSGPLEPVVIGTTPSLSSTLILIAEEKGFFTRHGLNVTIQENTVSTTSLANLVARTVDIAGASDYAFMNYLFTNHSLQAVASIAKTDVISIVARKDRGITASQNLTGKRIGCTKQQVGEFFLGRYLVLNGINSSTVTVVDLKPGDMPGAIANGSVDAVITWEPYVNTIQTQLGPNAAVFPAQEGQRYYWTLICTKKTTSERPEILQRVLSALVDSESYTLEYPEESQQIMANKLQLNTSYIKEVWPKYHLIISLDQSLISAMEDEARYEIQNNLTEKKDILNYRENIYPDALDAVKPQAVTIIK